MQTVNHLKQKGYNSNEILELMAADKFDIKIAENAIKNIYANIVPDIVENPKFDIHVVPVSYQEIKPLVEAQLTKLGAKEFISRLVIGENPLMSLNQKTFNSYCRLAENAIHDKHALAYLHNDLEKWFEEAMFNSVKTAHSQKNNLKIAASKDGKYIVKNDKNASCEVCIQSGTCTCKKFQDGHFADFGLACEHIIATADTVSPYERLIVAKKFKEEKHDKNDKNDPMYNTDNQLDED